MYLLLDDGQNIEIVKSTCEHNEDQPSTLHQRLQESNNKRYIFLFH